jgi:pilus assembly protein CpaF
LLSALCNFLPPAWRIVKIEDPEEIRGNRPTVQTVEARPQAVGAEVKPYTLADEVDNAMRMSPDYLVIGEVHDGMAAMSLFRALMTGHSGACTFHADSPREAA